VKYAVVIMMICIFKKYTRGRYLKQSFYSMFWTIVEWELTIVKKLIGELVKMKC
jgi:hypothetical protein